ncbi:hypothetical protein [Niameybacter massiliensis]
MVRFLFNYVLKILCHLNKLF